MSRPYDAYSVLMSVYCQEKADFLSESLRSMVEQTCPPDQMVVVCDGPLSPTLDAVLATYSRNYPALFTILRLPENHGIGYAANQGLGQCRNEIVFKMDADDIALPERCARQLREFAAHPELDLVGGYITEFTGTPDQAVAVKKVPLEHEAILHYARRRNPFNNQSIAYKKSKALACGGYDTLPRCEDYDFLSRLLQAGARAKNIPEVLVYYRLNEGAYKRRKDFRNTKGFITVRYRNWRRGFCGFWDFLLPTLAQLVLFLLPLSLAQRIYLRFLRK